MPYSRAAMVPGCRHKLLVPLALLLGAAAASGADAPRAGLRLLRPRALGAERALEVSAQATEPGVASLALRIDGREVAAGPAPRLDAEVPLAWPPRPQILEAEARDARGCPLELELGFLRQPARAFPVELRVTGVGCDEEGPWVRVYARPPAGERIERVLVWAGERPVGAADELPAHFRLSGHDLAEPFLRAEVRLASGARAEATQLFDRGRFDDVVEVRRGEARRLLPGREKASGDFDSERVRVRWRGQELPVVSVETGAELPLALAIAVDASPSTLDFRDRVLELASETARSLAPAGAAGAEPPVLVLFSESAVVTVTSADPARTAALADALPFGATALFDALAVALHENLAPGRRAALLAVTDGCDTGSATSAAEVADIARALGVPVFALVFDDEPCFERVTDEAEAEKRRRAAQRNASKGYKVDPADLQARPGSVVRASGWGTSRHALEALCRASGGELYRVAGKDDLSKIWRKILTDLGRQVVVVYEPSGPEVDPAAIEVEIAPPKRRGLFRR